MVHEIKVGVVCWIHAEPNPVTVAAEALVLSPDWVPKTYIGLVATANKPPPAMITDFTAFQTGKDFRAIAFCHLKVDVDEQARKIGAVTKVSAFVDGGYTPPFDRSKFWSTYLKAEPSMKDPAHYAGELSSVSDVMLQKRHANTALPAVQVNESVIANGLVKFRAGKHTDDIGVNTVQAPFHVPWVWSEFLLTYRQGAFYLAGIGSLFPTHSWYAQGKQVMKQAEVSDSSFPKTGWTRTTINEKALKLYPVLSAGVPASQTQSAATESAAGPVTKHLYTAPGASAAQTCTFKP